MKLKGKIFKLLRTAVSLALIAVALFCVCRRFPEAFGQRNTVLAAAAFTLTDGKYPVESGVAETSAPRQETTAATAATEPSAVPAAAKARDKSGYYDSSADHSGEAVYEIAEKTILGDGTRVGGCYVKNFANLSVDFNAALEQPLTFEVQKQAKTPQVLIYHTHTGESYMDEDTDHFYESYYSHTNNNDFNVVAVGDAIAGVLEKNGIATLHDTTVHDSTYNGSYDRSVQTVYSDMEKYPGIKVVLDIHRDALGTDEQKVKTVFEYNGKKGAQMMILSGCDPDNERGFVNWENNLGFALKLQSTAEQLYPGMTRPLDFGYFAYNEYVCDGSLLIEIGTDANSVDEAVYTGELLGDVLARVLS